MKYYLKNLRNYTINIYFQTKKYFNEKLKDKTGWHQSQDIITSFRDTLKTDHYHETYFDRSCRNNDQRICDTKGWFSCGGKYNEKRCSDDHWINPYGNKHDRSLFSTWDLDHQ